MESYLIDFKSWPQEIKDDFKRLIDQTSNTRVFELKKEIDNKYCKIGSILNELVCIKNISKKWKDEGKLFSINAENMALNIFQNICIPIGLFTFGKQWYDKVIADKEKRRLIKYFCTNHNYTKSEALDLANKCVNDVENNGICGKYDFLFKDQSGGNDVLNINADKGKLNNLEPLKKAKTFFKSKLVWGIHAGLSFINLFWSIYELRQTYKEADMIRTYGKRLDEIINTFKSHQMELGVLSDNFYEAAKRIKYVLSLIREDQKNLSDLIKEIIKRIEFQDSQKDKSVKGIISSIGLGIFGLAGGIVTSGLTNIVPVIAYGVSSLANIISLAIHAQNLSESSKYLKQYNALLKKSMEERSKMEKYYDELVEKLIEMVGKEKDKLEECPKFDLYSSISSISTNFDN